MTFTMRKALIVYCSPAGSTGHVARVIQRTLVDLKIPVEIVDLARDGELDMILPQLLDARDNLCLFIGSPVYASHAVPPVMEFIARLPEAACGCAVPFVTYGTVTSGTALHDMACALSERGYTVIGAAKVMARHSMMWTADVALGQDRPDEADDQKIKEMVTSLEGRLAQTDPEAVPLADLDYQSDPHRSWMKKISLAGARDHFPVRRVDEERCNQCGLCVELCPSGAVSLDPYPRFGRQCFFCFNCVRLCPQEAIRADLAPLLGRIRALKAKVGEPEETRTWT